MTGSSIRFKLAVACLMLPMAAIAYDVDSSGVSDVFENIYGRTLPAAQDADFDGYTNYQEYLLGTSPLDASEPGSFDFQVQGDSASMTVPNQVGLRFRLQSSQTLGSWTPIGDFQVSTGQSGTAVFDITGLETSFFRIELAAPLNSDTDGLDDWEEAQLGTDPLLSDTDNDLLDDHIETMVAGSDPHKVDSDGDGFVDFDEYGSGSDPDDADSRPPEILANPWSQPVTIRNDALAHGSLAEVWSAPVTIQNDALAIGSLAEVWSAPITIQNDALAIGSLAEVWSAPIVVRNDALAIASLSEVWSAPILVKNDYVPPTP